MKKLLLVFLMLFLLGGIASAQQVIVTPNQTTVYWDEDPADVALPGTLSYQVYVALDGTEGAVDPDNPDYETAPNATSQLITFATEGKYLVGVRTKRLLDDGVTEVYDVINWSNINGAETPNPFAYLYAVSPLGATNLRPTP